MPRIIAGRSIALASPALFGSIAFGLWRGFSSCGGYIWHVYLAYAGLALCVLAVLTLFRGSVAQRVCVTVLVIAFFYLAQAAGFAAYLGASSPGEFLRQMGATFRSGLC